MKFFLIAVFLFLPYAAYAVGNAYFPQNTTITINSVNYTIEAGSDADQVQITATSAVITTSSGRSLTIRSSNNYTFTNDGGYSTQCGSGSSYTYITITSSTSKVVTITPTLTDACAGGGGGGGGGGVGTIISNNNTEAPTSAPAPSPSATASGSPAPSPSTTPTPPVKSPSPAPTKKPTVTSAPVPEPSVQVADNVSEAPENSTGTTTAQESSTAGAEELPKVLVQIIPSLADPSSVPAKIVNATAKTSRSVSITAVPLVVLSTAASAVSVAVSGVSIFDLIRYIIETLLIMLGIKHRGKPWGTVYDAITKRPLSFAKVQLLDQSLRVLETRTTDRDGRYGFLVSPKKLSDENLIVQLFVSRSGYLFPSKIVTTSEDTILYQNIYIGGTVTIKEKQSVKFDIPLDPAAVPGIARTPNMDRNLRFKMLANNALAKVAHFAFAITAVAVPVNFVLHRTTFNLIMLIIFAITATIRIAGDLREKPYGLVTDLQKRQPMPYALLTLNNNDGTRKAFTVADHLGRYIMLSERGKYKMSAFTPGYIDPPRQKSDNLETKRGWIVKEIDL